MTSFGYPKHKYQNLVKINLGPRLHEEDWIKSLYIQYIIYNSSIAIRPHVCGSSNITKQKKIEKIMQYPSTIWYGGGLFLKTDIIMHSLINKCRKAHFLNGILSKNLKNLNCLKFNWCISISYTIKNSPKEFHSQL